MPRPRICTPFLSHIVIWSWNVDSPWKNSTTFSWTTDNAKGETHWLPLFTNHGYMHNICNTCWASHRGIAYDGITRGLTCVNWRSGIMVVINLATPASKNLSPNPMQKPTHENTHGKHCFSSVNNKTVHCPSWQQWVLLTFYSKICRKATLEVIQNFPQGNK